MKDEFVFRPHHERMPDGTVSATAVPQFTANIDYQRVHPVTTPLEPWILEGIGGIVVLWANAEWRLTGAAAIVQEYGRKESRRKLNGRADDALAEIRYGWRAQRSQSQHFGVA